MPPAGVGLGGLARYQNPTRCAAFPVAPVCLVSPQDEVLNEKGRALSSLAPYRTSLAKLLLGFNLPRLRRRAIALAETFATSAIASLDEAEGQVVAPAIAADELLRF
jgi:hypothetical protein